MKNLAKAYHLDADNYNEFNIDEIETHESNRVNKIHNKQMDRMEADAKSVYRLEDDRVRLEEVYRQAREAKRTPFEGIDHD